MDESDDGPMTHPTTAYGYGHYPRPSRPWHGYTPVGMGYNTPVHQYIRHAQHGCRESAAIWQ